MIESGYLVDTDVIINYLKGKSKSKEFFIKIIEGVISSRLVMRVHPDASIAMYQNAPVPYGQVLVTVKA